MLLMCLITFCRCLGLISEDVAVSVNGETSEGDLFEEVASGTLASRSLDVHGMHLMFQPSKMPVGVKSI